MRKQIQISFYLIVSILWFLDMSFISVAAALSPREIEISANTSSEKLHDNPFTSNNNENNRNNPSNIREDNTEGADISVTIPKGTLSTKTVEGEALIKIRWNAETKKWRFDSLINQSEVDNNSFSEGIIMFYIGLAIMIFGTTCLLFAILSIQIRNKKKKQNKKTWEKAKSNLYNNDEWHNT